MLQLRETQRVYQHALLSDVPPRVLEMARKKLEELLEEMI
jgi:hypothetical protein